MDISPLWPRHSRHILRDRNPHRRLSHAPACPPLLQTVGTETHYQNSIYDTRVRHRLLDLIRLLQTCDILGGAAGLLRGIRHCEFLHLAVPLPGTNFDGAEEPFSEGYAQELGLAYTLVAEVLRREL